MTRTPWTDAETATLRAGYRTLPIDELLAALPGRSRKAIVGKFYSLLPGDRRKPSKRPPRSVVEDLLRHAAESAGIAKNETMRMTAPAIWVRHRVIQTLRAQGYSLVGIGSVMGFDHTTVRSACLRELPSTPPAPALSARSIRRNGTGKTIRYAGYEIPERGDAIG